MYENLNFFVILCNLFQVLVAMSYEYASPVIENLPVSPVAPPKRIALPFATNETVCPNLAAGIFPKPSIFSMISCSTMIVNCSLKRVFVNVFLNFVL